MASVNRVIFDKLVEEGGIACERGAIFDTTPELHSPIPRDRVEGMLWGLAVGNALGLPTEGLTPRERHQRFGEIRDYLPYPGSPDGRGVPNVDTQMTFLTVEQILSDGEFDPGNLTARFCAASLVAMGGTLEQFVARACDQGMPWHKAGLPSAGNGALMRIAPVVLPYLREPSADMWVDAALATMITHNDAAAISASVAFTALLWDLLTGVEVSGPDFWVERYIEIAGPVESAGNYRPQNQLRFAGRLTDFVAEFVPSQAHSSVIDACDHWGSGAYLLETVPTVLHVMTKHAQDLEESIVRAANDTWDNDTTAALVGALASASHGRSAIPERWLEGHSDRVGSDPMRRLSELAAAASRLAAE